MKKLVIIAVMLASCQLAFADSDCQWENGNPKPEYICNPMHLDKAELAERQRRNEEAMTHLRLQEEEEAKRLQLLEEENAKRLQFLEKEEKRQRQQWAKKSPETKAAISQKLISAVKKEILLQLKDPESARFRNVITYNGEVACGEINAKNSYGGYIGFKRFYGGKVGTLYLTYLEESSGNSDEFFVTWDRSCVGK